MAVVDKPLSAEDKKKIDQVIPDLEAAIDKIDTLQKCYEDAAATAQKFDDDKSLANGNVPWDITNANRRNAFEYIYSEPLQTIMSGRSVEVGNFVNPDSSVSRANRVDVTPLSITTIEGFAKGVRYDQIFNDHQHFIKGPGATLSNLLTEARTNLDTFNIVNYQSNLTNAKKLLVNQMVEPVRIFIQSLRVTDSQITNPQSFFYKTGSSYGTTATFDPETIGNFDMGPEMDSLREQAGEIFTKLRDLFNAIDALSKIKEDILKRVVLNNQGFTEDPNEPGTFNKGTDAKENWGIKFSYTKTFNSNEFIRTTGQNKALNNSLTQTRTRDTNRQQALNNSTLRANQQLLEGINLEQTRHYYMSLLPAIKSNLPVQGGVDVPGAMPGLQFRIENTIVKHKVPGFSPIYQPLGIDCIKCTIVGLFTGEDGVDFSDALLKDLSTGLLADGTTLRPAKGGIATPSRASKNNNPFLNGGPLDYRNNPLVFRTGVDTPIPKNEKQQPNRAVLSEDAFSNAQEFYNEIVAPGVEIEVEINTKGRSGGKTGGASGPFRNSETGNPFFKALVKRMDIYYVRQDRAYFILDLLITNSGLIGEECINLTNVIEESTELFNETEPDADITLDLLEKCFNKKATRRYRFKKDRKDTELVIDTSTGLSYEVQNKKRLIPNSYLQPQETLLKMISAAREKSLSNGIRFNGSADDTLISNVQTILKNIQTGARKSPSAIEDTVSSVNIPAIPGSFPGLSLNSLNRNAGNNIRYRSGDNRFVVYNNNSVQLRGGEAYTVSFEEGIDAINIAVIFGQRSDLLTGLVEIVNKSNFDLNNTCNTAINDAATELEDTQTQVRNSDKLPARVLSLENIINSTNTALSDIEKPQIVPGTADSPELRDRLSQAGGVTKHLKNIEEGSMNETLISGLNDYLSLISKAEDAPAISNNSKLTTDLINTAKRNKTKFFSVTTGKVRDVEVITAAGTGGSGTGSQGNTDDVINVTLRTRVNGGEDFFVKSGNSTQAFPGTTSTVFNVQLGLYTQTSKGILEGAREGQQHYRIKSITIQDPYSVVPATRRDSLNASSTTVPNAPDNASPGDTNEPAKPSLLSEIVDGLRAQAQADVTIREVSVEELQEGFDQALEQIFQ